MILYSTFNILKVINITDGAKSDDQFVGAEADDEKEKLLKLTQKLKSECLSLREKLEEMEKKVWKVAERV